MPRIIPIFDSANPAFSNMGGKYVNATVAATSRPHTIAFMNTSLVVVNCILTLTVVKLLSWHVQFFLLRATCYNSRDALARQKLIR